MSRAISNSEDAKYWLLSEMKDNEETKILLKKLYDDGKITKKFYFSQLSKARLIRVNQVRLLEKMNTLHQLVKIGYGGKQPSCTTKPPIEVLNIITQDKQHNLFH